MASTISRVCGWISRNIFQGKEKNNPSIAGIPSQQRSWQIKILSLLTFGSLHDLRSFCWWNFSWTWYVLSLLRSPWGNFWPPLLCLPTNSDPGEAGEICSAEKMLWGSRAPPFVSEKGKNLWGLMWIKLSRDLRSLKFPMRFQWCRFCCDFICSSCEGESCWYLKFSHEQKLHLSSNTVLEFWTMLDVFFSLSKVESKTKHGQSNKTLSVA